MAISYFIYFISCGVLTHWQAPVKPSWKLNEPYTIWGRLRLTLSLSSFVLCCSQVKKCRCERQWRGLTWTCILLLQWRNEEPCCLQFTAAKRAEWTPSRMLDLRASLRPTGGLSPAWANGGAQSPKALHSNTNSRGCWGQWSDETLTRQQGRTLPTRGWIHQGDEARGWRRPWSDTQSCPWWQRQTGLTSSQWKHTCIK